MFVAGWRKHAGVLEWTPDRMVLGSVMEYSKQGYSSADLRRTGFQDVGEGSLDMTEQIQLHAKLKV